MESGGPQGIPRQQVARERVAQVVELELREPRSPQECLESTANRFSFRSVPVLDDTASGYLALEFLRRARTVTAESE